MICLPISSRPCRNWWPEMRAATPSRLDWIDALKAVASQLIVLHHLAFYGPMSDRAAELAPALFDALAQHGRLAVQVFLVVGGFLAARRWLPGAHRLGEARPWRLIVERYLRLTLPLAAMLVAAIAAAALARAWMTHDSVPGAPQPGQVLAHLLLLQDLLAIEALSAGVWYVAIDFQLFTLLVLVVSASAAAERRWQLREPLAPWAVLATVAAALFHFNRDADWDVAAPYFFGSYGLGVLAAWWGRGTERRMGLLLTVGALVALALLLEFRSRLALAACVALSLLWLADAKLPLGDMSRALLGWLSRISYAVFLIHFPVCLVVNAAFERFAPATAGVQALGLLLAWAASVAAGALFHRLVEQPASRWLGRIARPATT